MDNKKLMKELRTERDSMAPGEMRTKLIVKMPVAMRCFCCEEDYKFTKKFPMYICSGKLLAENADTVMWKCPKCGKSKVEKTDKGDGGRYWFEANRTGLVHVES